MTLSHIVTLFGAFMGLCLISGVWLALHLPALAALFHGRADIIASPRPPRAARETVVGALTAFGVGLAGTLSMQIVAVTS